MKLLITSVGPTLDSPIDTRFGRAAVLLLYDTETGAVAAHDNAQNMNATQGAGIQAAGMASRLGAEAVLTGHCGPKAFQALQAAGIRVFLGARGTARETLDQFTKGLLTPAVAADVAGHWA